MSYSIEQMLSAVQRERDKWRAPLVYLKDAQGNVYPVPVLSVRDDGDRIAIEIGPQQVNS